MSDLLEPPASDDFEWVNAWATGATTPSGKPKPEAALPAASTPAAAEPVAQGTVAAPVRIAAEPQAPPVIANPVETALPHSPVAPVSSFADRVARVTQKRAPNTAQFVHPATRRFFASLRTQVPVSQDEAPAAPAAVSVVPSAVPAPAPAVPAAAPIPAIPPAQVGAEASLVPAADQLERDIAEIECARDALLEPAPFTISDPRKPRSPFAVLRNAESVPILVGSVVGATLLIVFGAAASLISLR